MNSDKILEELAALYPEAKPALKYSSPYELLVAVILSAQCTDERVNKVTRTLFEKHNTPRTMLELSQEELENLIRPCGLFRSKAAHILAASKKIVEEFDGEVPRDFEKLKSLQGVGQKTANVVWAVAFGGDAIAVDTHVFRVANRLGLANARTPQRVELQLKEVIPRSLWSKAHHYLIYHGRRVCHARKPNCKGCTLCTLCRYFKENKN